MDNLNFGKPLQDHSQEELFFLMNNSSSEFGLQAQYELMRKLSLEDSRSSKRFGRWSLFIATISIFISITLSIIQIYH